jgi:hypothetical protein
MGALKRGLNPRFGDLGIVVCGGRGRHAVRTPDELRAFSERSGLNGEELARTSRLTARVDNNAIGDGFPLYLHSFVITKSGEWSVVQQGMNAQTHLARRYHWHSASVRDFTSEPHTAIVGEPQGEILNLVDRRAAPAQTAMLTIVDQSVEASLGEIRKLTMQAHHDRSRQRCEPEAVGSGAGLGAPSGNSQLRVVAACGRNGTAHAAVTRFGCRGDPRSA